MRQLVDLCEGILDTEFDIGDEAFTLKQLGYKCTNMSANDDWGRALVDSKLKAITGIEISPANRQNHNPYRGFEEYVQSEMVFHSKVSGGRDGMGMGKWKFAWMIRFVLDYCHPDVDEIRQFITDSLATSVRWVKVDVRMTKTKIFIKASHKGIWGNANMSMTLTKQ